LEVTASASNKAPTAAPPQQELVVLLLEEVPRNLLDVEGHHDVVTFRLLRSIENTARCGLVSDLGKPYMPGLATNHRQYAVMASCHPCDRDCSLLCWIAGQAFGAKTL
jgi:hypothetical protein